MASCLGVSLHSLHTHTHNYALRWSFVLPFWKQLKPFVRKMEVCRCSMRTGHGVQGDLEVAELLESWVLSPSPAAPSCWGWDRVLHPTKAPQGTHLLQAIPRTWLSPGAGLL